MYTSPSDIPVTPEITIEHLIEAKKALDQIEPIPNIFDTLKVRVNDAACVSQEWKQFKFPKSRKKRIRKKWSKDQCNFRIEEAHHCVHDIQNNILYVSSKVLKNIENSPYKKYIVE